MHIMYRYRIYPNRSPGVYFLYMVIDQALYEPLLHFTWAFISFRVLNPCVYLGPGVCMSPASIRINMVSIFESQYNTGVSL